MSAPSFDQQVALSLSTTIPLRECAPWCTENDGHARLHPEDRSCWSPFVRLPLTLMPPVEMGRGEWVHEWIDVVLRRFPEREQGAVVLAREGGDEWILTPVEAERLRDLLTEHLDLLEQVNR